MMTIEERLENMERELGHLKRRNRWLLGAILLVAGGLIFPVVFETTASRARAQVAGTAKEIRARSFVIEDAKGKVRGILAVEEFGPNLVLFDENGEIRVWLVADKDGPLLSLCDENGKNSVNLVSKKEGPELLLNDENDRHRASLTATKDGPRLSLYDENGKTRTELWASKLGPCLSLSDENGNERFRAGKTKTVTPDGKTIEYPESSLILFGPDGKVIWSAIK